MSSIRMTGARFALVFASPVANGSRERARFPRGQLGNPPRCATGCLYTTRMNESACVSPWRLSVAPMMDWIYSQSKT